MSISLHVEGIAGSTISQIAHEMVALANRVNIMVTCSINGCYAIAMPGDRPEEVQRQYDIWLGKQSRLPIKQNVGEVK